jgi:hypothetical protein
LKEEGCLVFGAMENPRKGKGKPNQGNKARGQGKQPQVSRKEKEEVKEQLKNEEELGEGMTDEEARGPTKWSNWLVAGRILVGAYPKRAALLKDILCAGAFFLLPIDLFFTLFC